MRERLFRGKHVTTKEWIIGPSIHLIEDRVYIFPKKGYDSPEDCEVHRGTVGDFTTLLDSEFRQIFEGDILAVPPRHKSLAEHVRLVEFLDGCFVAQSQIGTNYALRLLAPKSRVIGNIYDNPERF